MHVSELYVYPLKSARGIALDVAQLDERGIEHDRRWMLVDAAGVFISQRTAHRMALLDVALTATGLRVSAPGREPLNVPYDTDAPPLRTRVWRDEVAAQPVSTQADAWFSEFLQLSCRLVHMPDHARRVVDRSYVPQERIVGFADAFPLLLIGQASLDELNARLRQNGSTPIPMRRFRPNLVIAGGSAHEEDAWREIAIGDVPVDVVKFCARCVITTVDIETGSAGKEPLRTLATYRKHGSQVLFGQNAVHRALAPIRRGAEVRVISWKD